MRDADAAGILRAERILEQHAQVGPARIAVAAQGGEELVFLEPDRADLWVSPSEVSRAGNTLTASAELVPPDGKPFALDRSSIGFTVLGERGSVEVKGCSPG